ncbi:protein kinase domain-containing protein [Aeoliella mucimassa]|uniref:Tubulin-like protein n=1 Tax=Aeoliella mucimassa TaxID=2527972 RepID=A0A518AK37_9BACT|nr:tubulin-like doman-containing protein [Aeoliella mucimassa]QDU55092.1 Tubulin-like protein [Aeoliella mucimassa]
MEAAPETTTTIAPSVQLPDGYVATERIGSGGYGEVWRATAPGGVEKAVKIVFGLCDEELAERELKSLERIRSVRHPFVISLERFEIVDGRLIIVTELADMSLDACFRKNQESGRIGIPRDELLVYLRDAAEALDCLVERHKLQHLDIKPENLLVVGEHVKVGDFGLVKELATRSMNSMMGGMTPRYSAPEVFDDAPSPRSDQYSLAIVYQQMLTGQLPFPGRTPAQLAKQHTQAEPILHSLAESDRRVVAKALAKRPEQRYNSCREFVAALTSEAAHVPTRQSAAARPGATSSIVKPSNTAVPTSPVVAPVVETHPAPANDTASSSWSRDELANLSHDEGVKDISLPEINEASAVAIPTLVVGAGGLGLNAMNATRALVATIDGEDSPNPLPINFLAIDTDRETLKQAAYLEGAGSLSPDNMIHMPLKRPKEYRDDSQQLLRWLSRRWLYNIPRSLETRGYRPLGRIAAVDHAEQILSRMYASLFALMQSNPDAKQLRVVVIASTGGGTGSGILIDLGNAAKSLAGDLGISIRVDAMLVTPERVAGTTDSLPLVNAYSLLTELTHSQQNGNSGAASPTGPAERFESDKAPFQSVYWMIIPSSQRGNRKNTTLVSIAEQIVLEASNPVATSVFANCQAVDQKTGFHLKSCAFSFVDLCDTPEELFERLSQSLPAPKYKRATFEIGSKSSPLARAVASQVAEMGSYESTTMTDVVGAMALGIEPLQVAARLAEFYPDIADAALRVHAREDIEWQDLLRSHDPSSAGDFASKEVFSTDASPNDAFDLEPSSAAAVGEDATIRR